MNHQKNVFHTTLAEIPEDFFIASPQLSGSLTLKSMGDNIQQQIKLNTVGT